MRTRVRRLCGIAIAALLGCSNAVSDADAAADAAVTAALRSVTPDQGSPSRTSESWSVVVADSVADASDVAARIRQLLHVRPASPSDSIRRSLDVESMRRSSGSIELTIDVSTMVRCGPTWASRFAYSGEYVVHAHAKGARMILDSLRPVIFGDPSVCQTSPSGPAHPDR